MSKLFDSKGRPVQAKLSEDANKKINRQYDKIAAKAARDRDPEKAPKYLSGHPDNLLRRGSEEEKDAGWKVYQGARGDGAYGSFSKEKYKTMEDLLAKLKADGYKGVKAR